MNVRFAHVPVKDIRGKIVRNPGYNENILSFRGWCWTPKINGGEDKPLFFEALCESVEKEGVRNPILVYEVVEGSFLAFGGSRLRAVREVGLERIPAIVNDDTGKFTGYEQVTPDNWKTFFVDVPTYHKFDEDGFDYHYSLEKNRRRNADLAGFEWLGDEDIAVIENEFSWIEKWT